MTAGIGLPLRIKATGGKKIARKYIIFLKLFD